MIDEKVKQYKKYIRGRLEMHREFPDYDPKYLIDGCELLIKNSYTDDAYFFVQNVLSLYGEIMKEHLERGDIKNKEIMKRVDYLASFLE